MSSKWGDADWDRLIDDLRAGTCTPFLGAGACTPPLPTGPELSTELAGEYHYPFKDRENLRKVAHYAAIRAGDRVSIKQHVCQKIKDCNPPSFVTPSQPHALLAELSLPLYLTTNYDDFMFLALQERRKKYPHLITNLHRIICPWYEKAPTDSPLTDPNFTLSPNEPVVYHLHGSVIEPESIVLTDQDYVDFFASLAENKLALLPASIFPCLTGWPFLFIGYSLQDWTFNMVRRMVSGINRRRHVSVQLESTDLRDPSAECSADAKRHLEDHFNNWDISVFWKDASVFCSELRDRLGLPI